MAYTQADIDTLEQAIVDRKGAEEIRIGDQTIRFASIDDMKKQLSMMKAQVAGTNRTRYAAVTKGV